MQLPTEHLQKIKNVFHGIQGFVIFVSWALTIAVFTKSGKTDGRTKYFFALVRSLTSRIGDNEGRLTILATVLVHHPLPHLSRRCSRLQSYKTLRKSIRICGHRYSLCDSLACSICSCSRVDKCWKRRRMYKVQIRQSRKVQTQRGDRRARRRNMVQTHVLTEVSTELLLITTSWQPPFRCDLGHVRLHAIVLST